MADASMASFSASTPSPGKIWSAVEAKKEEYEWLKELVELFELRPIVLHCRGLTRFNFSSSL